MTVGLLVAAALGQVAAMPVRDWAATARADAKGFHEEVLASHPGPLNAADPGFAAREAAAYARLLRRTAAVRDLASYRFALKEYVASFDDGHVQFALASEAGLPTPQWPGFLTGFDGGGRQRVMTRDPEALVPLGAELKSCDGVPAATLAARNVGAFEGRWALAAVRATRGGHVLVDRGNPFVRRPVRCAFAVGRAVRQVTLAWRPLAGADALSRRLSEVNGVARPPIGARTLADGTRWYAMSSFNGAPDSDAAKALTSLIAGMRADRAALVQAPAIVLDLRGNGGGSSSWSAQIARLLWGTERVADARRREAATYVEWRASPKVIEAVDTYVRQFSAGGPGAVAFLHVIAEGLRQAQAAGQPLWREPDAAAATALLQRAGASGPDPAPPAGPVYVLTDAACASACLDAVDLWRALGAVQVGRETSADTFYMEVRSGKLPSGLASYGVPMKVYRGRARGSNVPWAPQHLYRGAMTDTAALEGWIVSLPERRR